jgi:hypothetical protein
MPVYYVSYPLALRSMNHTFCTMTCDSFSLINPKKSSQEIVCEHRFPCSGPKWRSWSDDHLANSYMRPVIRYVDVSSIWHKPQDWLDAVLGTRFLRNRMTNHPLRIPMPIQGHPITHDRNWIHHRDLKLLLSDEPVRSNRLEHLRYRTMTFVNMNSTIAFPGLPHVPCMYHYLMMTTSRTSNNRH